METKRDIALHTRVTRLEAENARLRKELAEVRQGQIRDAEVRALEIAKQEADAANRSKSEFLANMSHEIRTPMTAILGYADVLLSHLDDPDNRHCVETIKRNGKFLLEIINDILDLSKIEAGKLEIDSARVAPDEIVAEVTSLMHVRAREKQIPLIVQYNGDLPETIETDATRLRQILVNLVGNALKFTDEGEVALKVDFVDEPEPKVRFRVADTGIGISQSEQESLFEPFAQADTSVTRRYGGSGLGLAICRRLVERLGGELSVQSTPGEGSTFSVTVATGPLDGVEMVEPRHGITMSDSPANRPIPRLNHRVLVVDDRHEIRFLARYFIEKAGGEVSTRANGQQALECINQSMQDGEPYDAVVMDMQMPVMDGYEACRRLRQDGYEGTIVALTANAMRGDRKKCLDAGCSSYVRKPIDGRHLVELLAHHIADEAPPRGDEFADLGELDGANEERSASRGAMRAKREESVNMSSASRKKPEMANKHEKSDTDAPRRIMLVDDSKDLGEALGLLLRMRGFEVELCLDGKSAIAAAPKFQPDIVLLDLGLPDLDGYAVLQKLKTLDSLTGTRFIAVSGRSGAREEQRSLDEGFEHHVVKPVTADHLIKLF